MNTALFTGSEHSACAYVCRQLVMGVVGGVVCWEPDTHTVYQYICTLGPDLIWTRIFLLVIPIIRRSVFGEVRTGYVVVHNTCSWVCCCLGA